MLVLKYYFGYFDFLSFVEQHVLFALLIDTVIQYISRISYPRRDVHKVNAFACNFQ